MKILSLLFLTIMLGKGGCDAEAQSAKVKEAEAATIEYTANTRGFFQKITIVNKAVIVSSDRNGNDKPQAIKLSEADWKFITAEVAKLKLENLPTYKAPTEKRFYDGAAIANMAITYKGKKYQTADFDHGFPPVEIDKLVNKVVSFGKQL